MELNRIIQGDTRQELKKLPSNFIDCCVTSPPYWGLRDYGHDNQLGMEATPDQYVENMVEVFREVKRVLKPKGTLWLNLGDSYNNFRVSTNGNTFHKGELRGKFPGRRPADRKLKEKDLVGIPWMVAFALRTDGWYLRQDIIWAKPNPMPESVTDRCTKSHEYIFLMSKSSSYYYDNEAIATEALESSIKRHQNGWNGDEDRGYINGKQNNLSKYIGSDIAKERTTANKKSVWTVTTMPYSEAHFATFPERLIVDCIKAGCPIEGLVLDPFCGAGTTALVARKLNRNYIGIELNPEYIKISNTRLRNELGMFL